jgi:hypothetical protein
MQSFAKLQQSAIQLTSCVSDCPVGHISANMPLPSVATAALVAQQAPARLEIPQLALQQMGFHQMVLQHQQLKKQQEEEQALGSVLDPQQEPATAEWPVYVHPPTTARPLLQPILQLAVHPVVQLIDGQPVAQLVPVADPNVRPVAEPVAKHTSPPTVFS